MNYLNILENTVLEYIRANFTCAFFDVIMPIFSMLDSHGEIWILIAITLMCMSNFRENGVRLSLALIIGFVICNLILKPAFARARPFEINSAINLIIPPPTDFSFPSGHTVSSFASVPVLWKTDRRLGVASLILASLIAFSRLYLFVHYPTDIAAGVILGLTVGVVASKIRLTRKRPSD